MTFGVRLKFLREAKSISQAELGRLASVHHVTICRLEAGTTQPSWKMILKLANALKVSPADFVG